MVSKSCFKFPFCESNLADLQKKLGNNVGLYRDDGLAVSNKSPKKTKIIKKEITSIFKRYDLRITIEVNKKIVNFLDTTLNLSNDTHSPYLKENSIPLYVNSRSNHPPSVINNIPAGINRRLSSLASDQRSFDSAIAPYQKAQPQTQIQAQNHRKMKKQASKQHYMVQSHIQQKCRDRHQQKVPQSG